MGYKPQPLDTSDIKLSKDILELVEKLAKNTHDVWAKQRKDEGWTYGPKRNDEKRENPCLVPYEKLSEEEKEYDRNTSMETLKTIIKFGYSITKK